jgi:hypothetical protein
LDYICIGCDNRLRFLSVSLPVAWGHFDLRSASQCRCCHHLLWRHHLSVVRSTPGNGAPKLILFLWGGTIHVSTGVVYDEADEAALPPGKQDAAWLARASGSELACDDNTLVPVGGHFYIAYFAC